MCRVVYTMAPPRTSANDTVYCSPGQWSPRLHRIQECCSKSLMQSYREYGATVFLPGFLDCIVSRSHLAGLQVLLQHFASEPRSLRASARGRRRQRLVLDPSFAHAVHGWLCVRYNSTLLIFFSGDLCPYSPGFDRAFGSK